MTPAIEPGCDALAPTLPPVSGPDTIRDDDEPTLVMLRAPGQPQGRLFRNAPAWDACFPPPPPVPRLVTRSPGALPAPLPPPSAPIAADCTATLESAPVVSGWVPRSGPVVQVSTHRGRRFGLGPIFGAIARVFTRGLRAA